MTLEEVGNLYFQGNKTTWTGEDLAIIYTIYNDITQQNKVDQGCNSCRRETINFVRDAYLKMKKI